MVRRVYQDAQAKSLCREVAEGFMGRKRAHLPQGPKLVCLCRACLCVSICVFTMCVHVWMCCVSVHIVDFCVCVCCLGVLYVYVFVHIVDFCVYCVCMFILSVSLCCVCLCVRRVCVVRVSVCCECLPQLLGAMHCELAAPHPGPGLEQTRWPVFAATV